MASHRDNEEIELSEILTEDNKEMLLEMCFRALESHLKPKSASKSTFNKFKKTLTIQDLNLNLLRYPVFVSWYNMNTSSDPEGTLRGCVGTFRSGPLLDTISKYAVEAAMDSRFSKISKTEVEELRCEISILYSFQSRCSFEEWNPYTEGIRIEFVDPRDLAEIKIIKEQQQLWEIRKLPSPPAKTADQVVIREYEATYLPGMARNWGYDKTNTISQLIRKAGYNGKITPELLADIYGIKPGKVREGPFGISDGMTIYKTKVVSGVDPKKRVK